MSEILNLAKTFKKKSDETVQTIEQELDSVMMKLNESMTAKLKESENIIKYGTENLSKQSEQLQLALQINQDAIHTVLSRHTKEVQALINQGLIEHVEDIQTMIEGYTTAIEETIQETQSRAYQVIKSDMNKLLMMSAVVVILAVVLGLMLGVLITTKFIKPQVNYEQFPKTQKYTPKW